ncbi:hypothetical protein C1H46_037237 [Malus baccata]|uniref:Sulfite reductase [NADPH] flavoprotein alpha-component-like FAD-binding domain-containing protein n=1 Tax=Malus baccata TaxID=106549 RepID=A0A540KSP0_MALBA|nr:hypothetical protein C1H46_037237 [Malus baccata]
MEEERTRKKLLILYATQTGNALYVAERVGRETERRGCPVHLLSLDQYDAFVAKKLDRRLLDLGATPIVQRGLGDDQHPSGCEAALDPWMASFWNMLNKIDPNYLPNGPYFLIPYENFMAKPKVRILYRDIDKVDSQVSSKSGCKDEEVHHFEFEFVSSPIPYEVGDVLEVLPSQNPAAVDAFLLRCNLDPESFITLLLDAISSRQESSMSGVCLHPLNMEKKDYFVSPEGRDDLYQYNQRERWTVLEVLEGFPSVQMPFEWLVRLVPPLKRRAFSISSSPSPPRR